MRELGDSLGLLVSIFGLIVSGSSKFKVEVEQRWFLAV